MKSFLFPVALLLAAGTAFSATPVATPQIGPNFQYGSPAFRAFAQTSYQTVGLQGSFEDWLASAYTSTGIPLGSGTSSLAAALDARAVALRAASGAERVRLERETAQWAHTFVKKSIPKFSLERGFELANVVKSGERQCLAQSVIIAALLQRAGMQAGAVMVWANPQGQESNLGHVVAVIRLSSGADLLDDASDPTPFVHHQGLLVQSAGGFRFVKPVYAADDTIQTYAPADGSKALSVKDTSPLPMSYLQSQFDYYRGERAPGGFMTGKATPAGLKSSEFYLRRALSENSQNALAALVLGHVLRKEGLVAQAKAQYKKAYPLYQAQGHVPSGAATALAWVNAPDKSAGHS
ncbi:hypothetical protein MF271_14155 [Deinococcus sp. KNUC1210]|uniref:hypothetical protein n=1 Tax=Deinococcus sp. KNUC1210 TaxID=2917691 RepID=UPI001EEFE2EC|nr:hypothetical protein [Deinococcus sp. KNUC1210]ULH15088.1 hypothetical protein MF271_14155 [Deinococcus sp. KNUC1210]